MSGADPGNGAVRMHLRFGWWTVLVFLVLGAVLETLHGFKVGLYVDTTNEVRRSMWRLAHAHGTLLGLINVAFAATLPLAPAWPEGSRRIASRCLVAAAVLLPAGFFLGGVNVYGGDPGLGILLVPPGGALLFVAVLLAARGARERG